MVLKNKKTGRFEKQFVITKQQLQHFLKQGKSNKQIAEQIGCSMQLLSQTMKSFNFKCIKRRELNVNYFRQKNNHNMWYILGLFMSDGCLSYNKAGHYNVIFYGEEETIKKIQRELKSTHKLRHYPFPYENNCAISLTNKQLFNDLTLLGVTERKSLTLQLPQIPNKFFNHFVRGYFDGDGSIYKSKKTKFNDYCSFTSGSKLFLNQLKKRLEDFHIISNCKIIKGTAYELRYPYKDSLYRLYNFMYNPKRSMKLTRKYKKYTSVVGG